MHQTLISAFQLTILLYKDQNTTNCTNVPHNSLKKKKKTSTRLYINTCWMRWTRKSRHQKLPWRSDRTPPWENGWTEKCPPSNSACWNGRRADDRWESDPHAVWPPAHLSVCKSLEQVLTYWKWKQISKHLKISEKG